MVEAPELVAQAILSGNFGSVVKSLNKVQKDQLPFAVSKSIELALRKGRKKMLKTIEDDFDRPIPIFTRDRTKGRGRPNKAGDPIWIQFDTKKDIQRKGISNAGGYVRFNGVGRTREDRERQQEIFHRHAKGTTETSSPLSAPIIVKPTRKFMQGGIPGLKALKLDEFGNIKNYRRNIQKRMLNDKTGKFFEVRVDEGRGRGRFNNGRKLSPGLYMRVQRKRRYSGKRHPVTKRRRGPYDVNGNSGRKQETIGIVQILRYERLRDFKQSWDFKPEVVESMRKEYRRVFLDQLNNAILTAKKPNRSGQVGLL